MPSAPRTVRSVSRPTSTTPATGPSPSKELAAAYKTQIEGLTDGGADCILVETIFDTLNAKAAIFALQEVRDERGIELPVIISGTITDASGRTLSGQTVEAFYISVAHAKPLCIGLNCALGAKEMRTHLASLAKIAECYVHAYPNAGLPNEMGEYDQGAEEMQAYIRDFAESGLVNMIGGLLWDYPRAHPGHGAERRCTCGPAPCPHTSPIPA